MVAVGFQGRPGGGQKAGNYETNPPHKNKKALTMKYLHEKFCFLKLKTKPPSHLGAGRELDEDGGWRIEDGKKPALRAKWKSAKKAVKRSKQNQIKPNKTMKRLFYFMLKIDLPSLSYGAARDEDEQEGGKKAQSDLIAPNPTVEQIWMPSVLFFKCLDFCAGWQGSDNDRAKAEWV